MSTQPIVRNLAIAALLVAVVAGCSAPADEGREDRLGESRARVLVLEERARVLGSLAREPTIDRAPDGTLYVSGFSAVVHEGPQVWKSQDDGITWQPLDTGGYANGALGNSDVDLAVGPDGTVYLATMMFTVVGGSIAIGASSDAGASWKWSVLSAQPGSDRPWVEVAPDATAHVVWNDGIAVHHATSSDRGTTWSQGPEVHRFGGAGMLAIAPGGTLAVRIIPASGSGYTKWEADGVAVSTDRGQSWAFHPLAGTREYGQCTFLECEPAPDGIDRWADPLAFDVQGTLWAAWGENTSLLLGASEDLGRTWQVHQLVQHEGRVAFFPSLRAAAEGQRLGITYFTTDGEGGLQAHVGLIQTSESPPTMQMAAFVPPTAGGTSGEYFQVAFLEPELLGFAVPVEADEYGFAFYAARPSRAT